MITRKPGLKGYEEHEFYRTQSFMFTFNFSTGVGVHQAKIKIPSIFGNTYYFNFDVNTYCNYAVYSSSVNDAAFISNLELTIP